MGELSYGAVKENYVVEWSHLLLLTMMVNRSDGLLLANIHDRGNLLDAG